MVEDGRSYAAWARAERQSLPMYNAQVCKIHNTGASLSCWDTERMRKIKKKSCLKKKKTGEQKRHDLPLSSFVISDFSNDPEAVFLRCLTTLSFMLLIWDILFTTQSTYLNARFCYDSFLLLSIPDSFLFYISRACSPTRHGSITSPAYLVKLHKYIK